MTLDNFANIIILSSFYVSYGYRRSEQKVMFLDANAKCHEVFGTNLASIHSDEDYSDIVNICGKRACWIGAEMTNKVNITWTWIDGSLWDYENWGTYSDIPQGQGLTSSEYFACIASRWYAQNGSRIHECDGSLSLYPICNEPEPTENVTSLSSLSESTQFTPTRYYSVAPTSHPSTLFPSQSLVSTSMEITTDKVTTIANHESLLLILVVLLVFTTFVAVSFAAMYCRAKQPKTNQSQESTVEVDIGDDDSNTTISSHISKDEIVISLTSNDNAVLSMVVSPGMNHDIDSGNDTSVLLEDMYGSVLRLSSGKITRTAGDVDDEDLKFGGSEHELIALPAQPTFDYDLEGRQMTERSLNTVEGKNIISTKQ